MYKVNYLISEIVAEVAKELGLKVIIEPKYQFVGQITTKNGRKKYFRNTNFDLNSLGASEIARDKAYAAFFMAQMGYPIPQHDTFFSEKFAKTIGSDKTISAAKNYAQKIGYPVIVKPNTRSQGVGVEKVHTPEELEQSLQYIHYELKERVAIVEEFVTGKDYRIVVVDDVIVAAYQRIPLKVTGDGTSTIYEHLQQKQKDFEAVERDTVIQFDDPRFVHKLKNTYNMTLESIPSQNEEIYVLDAANLSAGGDAVDCTTTIHPSFAQLAIKITSDMGLRLCGVDIIIDGDISEPEHKNYRIIEINAAPGLDHYAQVGEAQLAIVKDMYKKVIIAMTK